MELTRSSETLAGETEQAAVLVTIVGWRDRKDASFDAWFEIAHLGDVVVRVALPDGWRAICRQVGLDDENLDTEGYLCTLAKLEFSRQRGHMTCARCEAPRASAPAKCKVSERHDWTVAR